MLAHALPQARQLRPRGLGDLPRLVADLLGRHRGRADARLHRRGLRGRHQLLRHGERLRPRRRRDGLGRDPLRPPARLLHPGDQGLGPDVGRPGRPRPVGRADRQADRRLAASGCRPTTSTSTRRTASIPTCRSRRRSRRCSRSSTDGKARYLGFSEWTAEQIQAAIDIAGPDLFVSSQPQYSMLWRAPEAEVFPLCAANGISQIVWSPLAQGVLTGKYRPGAGAAGGLARRQRATMRLRDGPSS